MDTISEPTKSMTRNHIAISILEHSSITERSHKNPLISNKGFVKSPTIQNSENSCSDKKQLSKMGTEVDLAPNKLVMNMEIMERQKRFLDSIQETLSTENKFFLNDSAVQGSLIENIEESKENKEFRKNKANIVEIDSMIRKCPEKDSLLNNPFFTNWAEQSSVNSASKKAKEEHRDSNILSNDSIKVEEKINYISSYNIGNAFRLELEKLYKVSKQYKELPYIKQRISELKCIHRKTLARNIIRFEKGNRLNRIKNYSN